MDFFDNAVVKAKEAFDIAYKKTNEVVNTSKQKFDIATLQNKRQKDFEALGEIYYNLIKDSEIEDSKIQIIVAAINEKNEKITAINEEINATKHRRICPVCSAVISEEAVYCSVCGAKLTIDE